MSIKVLHLVDSGGLYGAEMVLLNLVDEQLKVGLSPLILSAGTHDISEKPLEKAALARGLPFITWRMRAGLNILQAWKIMRFAQKEGFQLFHSHGYKFNILIGAFPLSLRLIPLLVTLHGHVNASRYTKMWVYELLDNFFLRRVDSIVLVNSRMRDLDAVRNFDLSRVHEIANGIPTNRDKHIDISNDFQVQDFLKKHSPIVGAVGRLSYEKGLCYLVDAFSKLRTTYPELGLLIIGEGSEHANLKREIQQKGIADHVLMPGYRYSIPAYLSKLSVFVMPSLTEGLPIVLLEAMLESVPVVASNVGGIPEVLDQGRYGKLVYPKRPDQLSEAIDQVLNNIRQAKKIALEGRQRIIDYYSISSMEYSYRQLYLSLLTTYK